LIGYHTTVEDLPSSIKFKWYKQVTELQDDIYTYHSIIDQTKMTWFDVKSPLCTTQIRMDHAEEHANFDVQSNSGGTER
jgi:hypothetical protein